MMMIASQPASQPGTAKKRLADLLEKMRALRNKRTMKKKKT